LGIKEKALQWTGAERECPVARLQRRTDTIDFHKSARHALLFALIALCLCFSIPLPAGASTVRVEVIHSQDQYEIGKNHPVLFRLSIAKPWYIHGTDEEGHLIPTVLSVREKPGLRIDGIRFPPAERKKIEFVDKPMALFSGEILAKATLRLAQDAPLGIQVTEGKLSYQACSTTACLPPEEVSFSVSVKTVPPGTVAQSLNQDLFRSSVHPDVLHKESPDRMTGTGFWLTLLGFFLGGLALSFSPCIYPLIPITVSYFSQGRQKFSVYTLINVLFYILGLAITNSLLGVWAALSGRMVGSFLQSPWVILFLVCMFIALALSSFGLWEFRIPAGLTRLVSMSFGGYFGTFFMGLTLGIIAAPCLGPFLIGLLTYVAQKGDPYLGFISFFVLSIGLGLPLALLALFSGALSRLPSSGDWMLWVRKLMGWVLVFMAAYIAKPLIPFHLLEVALTAAVLCVAAIHLGWVDQTGASLRRFSLIKRVLGVVMIGGALFYLWTAGFQPKGIEWVPYEESLMTEAAREKQPVILDFSAEWCEPCLIMERTVFRDPMVVKRSRHFLNVRVDFTVPHPHQSALMERYDVKGVPTIVFINREGVEERGLRIESLVNKSQFLEKMKALAAE
jgi:thiol:disulfide interchange protein DsbD